MTTSITTPAKMHPKIAVLLESVIEQLGLSGLALADPDFELKLRAYSGGQALFCTLQALDSGGPDVINNALSGSGYVYPATMVDPASGGATLDGVTGTATLVASTKTITVPTPADGGTAVPVGSLVFATVTTAAGNTSLLSAVRASATTITVSSPGASYNPLLESAGVASAAMIAGVATVTLANVAGDRLVAMPLVPGGTPGATYSCQSASAGASVLVHAESAAGALATGDTSTVIVYNFGQSAVETSIIRWCVIRP